MIVGLTQQHLICGVQINRGNRPFHSSARIPMTASHQTETRPDVTCDVT